jgi:hypothetical protein
MNRVQADSVRLHAERIAFGTSKSSRGKRSDGEEHDLRSVHQIQKEKPGLSP